MTESTSHETSYRESHKDKGEDYHATFDDFPHRNLVWRFEQDILLRILQKFFGREKPSHLDFASGTGRILTHLAPHVRSSTALDISESMLAIARENSPASKFIVGDITRESLLNNEKFDLITAFRFFPNAEKELRAEVIIQLSRRLAPGGRLVFNNHMNSKSLLHRLSSLRRRTSYENVGMTEYDVRALIGGVGLKILARYPVAVAPVSENRMWFPNLFYFVEKVLTLIPGASRLAQNVIYVCVHDGQ